MLICFDFLFFSMRNLLLLIAIILTSSLAIYANQEQANNDPTQLDIFCGGSGTAADPYQICTVEELAALADYVNAGNNTKGVYYKLMNDLDMGHYLSILGEGYNDGAGWKPIGSIGGVFFFQGNFNGNHKVIYNLTINRPDTEGNYLGLFGSAMGATIQNLGLKNGNITGGFAVGSLLGGSYFDFSDETPVLITNCFALCYDIQGRVATGGLVGFSFSTIITNSYCNSNITGIGSLGGLVGEQHRNAIIANCYASGNVTGLSSVGGLAGWNNGSTIKNSIAANSSVITGSSASLINRISTNYDQPGIYHNNYANNEMVLQADGIDVEIIDGSDEAGTGKELTTFQTFDFYNTESHWHPSSLWSIDTEFNPETIWRILDQTTFPFFQQQRDIKCLTQGIFYVDHTKDGNGTSWEDAYSNLAGPLLLAAKQHSGAIEVEPNDTIRAIYVAEGTYFPLYSAENYNFTNQVFPEIDGGRDNAFVLVAGVKIYGGFVPQNLPEGVIPPFGKAGRNGTTILSGNINGNNEDNAYHVIIGANIPEESNTLIDGVTISGGNANASSGYLITVNNHDILGQDGGGMVNCYSSPILNHVTISGNTATLSGGGMLNRESSPTLINVAVKGNSATHTGGGMMNQSSSTRLTNVTIAGNRAGEAGGGMHNSGQDFALKINNSIIWGNNAEVEDNIHNSIDDNSMPVYAYSLIQGSGGSSNWENSFGIDGGNNIDDEPFFEAPMPPSAAPTTEGNYNLQCESPAISAGNNDLYLFAGNITSFFGETDVAGNPRLVWNDIDMGAYETPKCILPRSGIVYVDHTKFGNGSSWEKAYHNFADPLILAAKQRSGAIEINPLDTIREIYVAEGAYYPMYNADGYNFTNKIFPETDGRRDNAFVLVAGVKIYGGFVPDEIPFGRDGARPVSTLPDFGTAGRNGITILSGNINGNNTNNAYHVLIGADIPENSNTLIDGFTISDGNADASSNIYQITVNNYAINGQGGGGMHNRRSSPILNHVTISENTAIWGGGMAIWESSPTLINVAIKGNRGKWGGGIDIAYSYFYSPPILTNVTISGNVAEEGGGIYNENSYPTLTNVTISGNKADNGGGIYNNSYPYSLVVNNSIIWGNATNNIYHRSGSGTFAHSLIEGSGGSDNWNALLGTDEGNNIDADPLFIDPVPAALAPTIAGDYSIGLGSPGLSAGSNLLYLTAREIDDFTGETDLAGNPRLVGYDIDMGAYEYQGKIYTITATAGTGGTIDPSGTVVVYEGGSKTFNFTPETCYEIDRVLIDGVNNAAAVATGTYTFTNITGSHTIRVLFKLIDYTTPISVFIEFGETYDFFGDILSKEGIYYHTLSTVQGCDSIIKLILTVGDGFIPVMEIIDVPLEAWIGAPHRLLSKVLPEDATHQAIVWSIKDTGTTEARLVTRTLIAPKKGTVIVTATIANGTATGVDYTQDFAIEVKVPYNSQIQYLIYPNPTTGEFTIKNLNLNIQFEKISIYNLMGSLVASFEPVYEEPADEGIIIADISPASAGVYLVVITTDKGVATKKVVKK